jgi:hypothetical protein
MPIFFVNVLNIHPYYECKYSLDGNLLYLLLFYPCKTFGIKTVLKGYSRFILAIGPYTMTGEGCEIVDA